MVEGYCMEFPALKDTDFPDLKNIDVYRYKNNFDYENWQPETQLKLLSVPWDSSYRYTVEFETDSMRDNWLNDQHGYAITLTSDFARLPDSSVRVPLPANEAARYNYCVVDIPQYPTEGQPLEYVTNRRVKRYCYFISEIIYRSPSATELMLMLDVWTTYIHSVDVNAVFLERGHAPMLDVNATQFLANPIKNCDGLLTDDVNYGEATITAGHELKELHSNSVKMLLLASTIPYADIARIGAATVTSGNTAPTFNNRDTRSGYQELVNNYRWSANSKDYSNVSMPSSATGSTDATMPNGLYIYAISYDRFNTSKGVIAELAPHFLMSIQAAYVVPNDLITQGAARRIAGITFYEVKSKGIIDAGTFKLSKKLFNYPEKYANIAKLYTYPYAQLEFSDDSGASFSVRVENTGDNIHILEQVSVAFPFINWNVFISNVGASAENSNYTWRDLLGNAESITAYASDFIDFLINWQIPTYALYADNASVNAMRNFKSAQQQRNNAIVSYQSTARSANTARENALDSNATAKTNTDASNDTTVTNVANANATSSANLDIANATGTTNVLAGTTASYNINTYNNSAIDAMLAADQALQDSLLETDKEKMAQSTIASGIGGVISGIAEGALSGAGIGATAGSVVPGPGTAAGAAAGAIVGSVGAVVGAVTSGMQNAIIANAAAEQLGANKANQSTHATQQIRLNNNGTLTQNDVKTAVNARNVTASTQQNNNTISMSNTNANNTAATAKANASRSKATGDANATYSRNTTIENAQAALTIAQQNYEAQYDTDKLNAPIQVGNYTGNPAPDAFKRRILHMRVKTQDKNAIARAGDYFKRYGYAYEGFYDFKGWLNGGQYCYWKAREILIKPNAGVSAGVAELITAIIMQGTTVYKTPELVGVF